MGIGVPIVSMAWLLEQLDSGRIKGGGKAARIGLCVSAIGVETHRCPTIDCPLDRLHARKVSIGVLADFDLYGTKPVLQPSLDLALDIFGGRAVEWRQKRQSTLLRNIKERMALQHLDC